MKRNRLAVVILLFLLACLSAGALIPCGLISAEDESSVDASVTVNESIEVSYGASVIAFNDVLWPRLALGKPDHLGTFVYRNGWMEIKLEKTIAGCVSINIWAANLGWQKSQFTIYISDTGKKWGKAGTINVNRSVLNQYNLTGNFGNVGYLKLNRNGSRWSIGIIDAVGAKGGDKSKKK
jgi:hypothetical protein